MHSPFRVHPCRAMGWFELGSARLLAADRRVKCLARNFPPPADRNIASITTSSASSLSATRDSPPPRAHLSALVSSPASVTGSSLSSLLPLSLNPFNVTVNLITARLKRQHGDAEVGDEGELLEAHLLPFLRPDDVSRVLLRCQSLPLPSLRFFRWAQSRLLPSPDSFALLVHVLASSPAHASLALPLISDFVRSYPCLDDVFQAVLLAAASAACPRPAAVFGLLVKIYARLDRIPDAIEICRRAIAAGFVPDNHAFNCLLNSLAKAGHLDRCWDLYGDMRRAGVVRNSYTFNILVRALCRGSGEDGVTRATEFLEEIESEGFDPDLVTYNTLMNGYCRRGMLDHAFYLYKIMHRRGVEPDLVSHTILTDGLCRDGKVLKARQLFDAMLHRGLCPDSRSYNVLINGYCREGKLKESRLLIEEMISSGFLPDTLACGTIVEAHVKGRRLLPCLNLMTLLRKVGVIIPLDAYKSLVSTLCSDGRPSAARSLLKHMQLDGYEPNLEIYNLLIGAFCKCDFLESEALDVKKEMVGKGVRPDVVTYQILIKWLCSSGKSLEGECLMKEMVEWNIQPDSSICAALVSGWCKEGDLCKAEYLLVYFAEKFHIYDSSSYNSLIRLYCDEKDMLESLELQDRLMKLGFIPNDETCRSLIRGLSKLK